MGLGHRPISSSNTLRAALALASLGALTVAMRSRFATHPDVSTDPAIELGAQVRRQFGIASHHVQKAAAVSSLASDTVHAPGVRFTLMGAAPVKARSVDGLDVYMEALPGGDLVRDRGPALVEDYLRFRHKPDRAELVYSVQLEPEVKSAEYDELGGIRWLDANERVVSAVPAAHGIDANGRKFAVRLALDGGCQGAAAHAEACTLHATWAEDVAYPAIVDPTWTGGYCGDGIVDRTIIDHGGNVYEVKEECDDGNSSAGDGCSSSCKIEDGFSCRGRPYGPISNFTVRQPAHNVGGSCAVFDGHGYRAWDDYAPGFPASYRIPISSPGAYRITRVSGYGSAQPGNFVGHAMISTDDGFAGTAAMNALKRGGDTNAFTCFVREWSSISEVDQNCKDAYFDVDTIDGDIRMGFCDDTNTSDATGSIDYQVQAVRSQCTPQPVAAGAGANRIVLTITGADDYVSRIRVDGNDLPYNNTCQNNSCMRSPGEKSTYPLSGVLSASFQCMRPGLHTLEYTAVDGWGGLWTTGFSIELPDPNVTFPSAMPVGEVLAKSAVGMPTDRGVTFARDGWYWRRPQLDARGGEYVWATGANYPYGSFTTPVTFTVPDRGGTCVCPGNAPSCAIEPPTTFGCGADVSSDARIPPVLTPKSSDGSRSVYATSSLNSAPNKLGRGEIKRTSGYQCRADGSRRMLVEDETIAERLGKQAQIGDRDLFTVRGGEYFHVVDGSVRSGAIGIRPLRYDYGDGVVYQSDKPASPIWDTYRGDANFLDGSDYAGRWYAHVSTYDRSKDLTGIGQLISTNFLGLHDLDIRGDRRSAEDPSKYVCPEMSYKSPITGDTEFVPHMWSPLCGRVVETFVMTLPKHFETNYGYSFPPGGTAAPATPPGMTTPDETKCDGHPSMPSGGATHCWGFHKWRCPNGGAGPCNALGPIKDSTPVIVGPPNEFLPDPSYTSFAGAMQRYGQVMYVQESGMLHAFDLTPNVSHVELWGFVPPGVQASLPNLYPNMTFPLLNATPVVRDVPLYIREQDVGYGANIAALSTRWKRVLLSSLGTFSAMPETRGYTDPVRGYYALDVSNPRVDASSAAKLAKSGPLFLWQIMDEPSRRLGAAAAPGKPLYIVNTEYDRSDTTPPADGQRGSLFGRNGGTPAITTLTIKDKTNPNFGHQIGVAILPGGIENSPKRNSSNQLQLCARTSLSRGSSHDWTIAPFPLRPNKLCWGPSCSGAGTAGCEEPVKGRYVVLSRLDTGETIRVFGRKSDFAGGTWGPTSNTPVDKDMVIDTPFDAPMTGVPFVYPAFTGAVATKFFMSDAEGIIWRFDVASNDPSRWRADIFFDPYAKRASAPDEWRSLDVPFEGSLDPAGQLVLLFSTGEQKGLQDYDSFNAVFSVTEQLSINPAVGGHPKLNHYHLLPQGTRVVGPMALESGTLYYAIYKAAPPPGGSCPSAPHSFLCARDYLAKKRLSNGTEAAEGSGGLISSASAAACSSTDSEGCCDMGDTIYSGVAIKPPDQCITSEPIDPNGLPTAPSEQTTASVLWVSGKQTAAGAPSPQLIERSITTTPAVRRSVLDSWVAVLE